MMIKVGLIGPGDIGAYLGQVCGGLTGVELAAIAGSNPAKLGDYTKRFGIPAFAGYSSMLEETDLDAVIIATPSDTHARITLDCIQKGLHVFCEKPMALSTEDCDEMITAARRAKVKLMVGQVLREMPVFVKVREILTSGKLGRPLLVNLVRAEKMTLWGWYLDPNHYRSVFHEMVVHEFDLLRVLIGEVDEIEVIAAQRSGHDPDYDTPSQIRLVFQDGAIGTLTHHWNSPLTLGSGTVFCEGGTIRYNWRGGNWIEYKTDASEAILLDVAETDANNGYRRELVSFFDWIRIDTPPLISAEDGRAAVVLAEMAYISRQTGKPVKQPFKAGR